MAGELYDRASIVVRAGNGGDGLATFRREKHVPRGGPDGGDGGRGGDIYLVVDGGLNTLLPFKYKRHFDAEHGGNGGTSKKHGRNGAHLELAVPPGTVVRTTIDGEAYTIDLLHPGQRLLAARGGKGGLGNTHFATSTRQVPRIAELGEPGQQLELELELKLIADVGLVGFPNAGKSTLISVMSAAQPKIAAYPFTTLQPNLGVAEVGNYSFVVADIPGLIEGAHRGVGLGHDFLRHVERTRLLIHVVDAAGVDGRDPLDDYHKINEELRLYAPELAERPQLVALNKADLPEAQQQLARLHAALALPPDDVFVVSAATTVGVAALLGRAAAVLQELGPVGTADADAELLTWPVPEVDPNAFAVEREFDAWRVRGKKIERLVSMTNFAQAESLDRLERVLKASGISAALEQAGVQEGDRVRIEKAELLWTEAYGD
jgi:GTPase